MRTQNASDGNRDGYDDEEDDDDDDDNNYEQQAM